jgi:hypothetical protein
MPLLDLSERERVRILRSVDYINRDGLPKATGLLTFSITMAVLAIGVWLYGWVQFRAQAHTQNMTVLQVQRLSGAHGRALSAAEADLVQFSWVLEITSLVVVIIALTPLAVLFAYRAGRFQAKVFMRLVALGGP